MSIATLPKVGILFGQERSFPEALVRVVNERYEGRVCAEPVKLDAIRQESIPFYDVIVDRISHEVPFYRTFLKVAAARGSHIINNPFWWSSDDKFLCNVIAEEVGVAVPKTVLLPHKERPDNTSSDSFTNLNYPVDWEGVFAYLGFPIFMKPAFGGGWKDVYKVNDPDEFFSAYSSTRNLSMIAQEAIEFTEYFRCYCLGRSTVRLMRWNPRVPFHERYDREPEPIEPQLEKKLRRDCLVLCEALGYDLNTIELAVRDGVPYGIDFMNPAPDCDVHSVGEANFEWVVSNMADLVAERALSPRPIELTGSWPQILGRQRAAPSAAAKPKRASGARKTARSGGGHRRSGKSA